MSLLTDTKEEKKLDLSKEELKQIRQILGRNPRPTELIVFDALWSRFIAMRNANYWLYNFSNGPALSATPKTLGFIHFNDHQWLVLQLSVMSANKVTAKRSLAHPDLLTSGALPIYSCVEWWARDEKSDFFQFAQYNKDLLAEYLKVQMDCGIVEKDNVIPISGGNNGNCILAIGIAEDQKQYFHSDISHKLVELHRLEQLYAVQYVDTKNIFPSLVNICAGSENGLHIKEESISRANELLYENAMVFLAILPSELSEEIRLSFTATSCEVIDMGMIADDGHFIINSDQRITAKIPIKGLLLSGGGSNSYPNPKIPSYLKRVRSFPHREIGPPKNLLKVAKQMAGSNAIQSWMRFRPYFLSQNEQPAIGVIQKSSIYPLLNNPVDGVLLEVADAAKILYANGFRPQHLFASINLHDIQSPESYWIFQQMVKGLKEVGKKLELNIQHSEVPYYPTPSDNKPSSPLLGIALLGREIMNRTNINTIGIEADDHIYMVGNAKNILNGSEYVRHIHQNNITPPTPIDWNEEIQMNDTIVDMQRLKFVTGIQPVGKGGLFFALVRLSIESNLGFEIETVKTYRSDAFLFEESPSRILVSVSAEKDDEWLQFLIKNNLYFIHLGEVFGNDLTIDNRNFESVGYWKKQFSHALNDQITEEEE